MLLATNLYPVGIDLTLALADILPGGRPIQGLPPPVRLIFLVIDGDEMPLGLLDLLAVELLPADQTATRFGEDYRQLATALGVTPEPCGEGEVYRWEEGKYRGFTARLS